MRTPVGNDQISRPFHNDRAALRVPFDLRHKSP